MADSNHITKVAIVGVCLENYHPRARDTNILRLAVTAVDT